MLGQAKEMVTPMISAYSSSRLSCYKMIELAKSLNAKHGLSLWFGGKTDSEEETETIKTKNMTQTSQKVSDKTEEDENRAEKKVFPDSKSE